MSEDEYLLGRWIDQRAKRIAGKLEEDTAWIKSTKEQAKVQAKILKKTREKLEIDKKI